jgi:hypothetical protein
LYTLANLLLGLGKFPSSLTFFPFQRIFPGQISAQRRAAVAPHPSGETIAFSVFTVKQSEAASLGTRTALGGVTGNGFSPEPWAEGKKMRRAKIFFSRNNFFQAAILFRTVCVRLPLFRFVCARNSL